MVNEEEINEIEERVEREELEGEEAEEERGEIVIDQLKLFLDITKLWKRILENKGSIDDLKSIISTRVSKKPFVTQVIKKEKKEKKKKAKTKKTKSRSKPKTKKRSKK
ncbi:MAG: hypothetical protein QXE81_04275 [Desulfurococcaceae archaeon]